MSRDLLPPDRPTINPDHRSGSGEGAAHGSHQTVRNSRVRVPVGLALGLIFSVLLVVICGAIIAYMAAADRRIAGRLLDEQAQATLNGNKIVLERFFQEQDLLLQAFGRQAPLDGAGMTQKHVQTLEDLLPEGARLDLGQKPEGEHSNKSVRWSDFQVYSGFETGVKSAEIDLGNGQVLIALYPQPVFAHIAGEMSWDGRQQPFLLAGRDKAIVIQGLPETAFAVTAGAPLPDLASLTDAPLHQVWQDQPRSHDMGGKVDGRVFPSGGRMYTAIYTEMTTGPGNGWILGTLYHANQFGAALDQTRIVLYAALGALVIGALLSFLVGRMLGRPLARLAHTAAGLRQLDFGSAERLPSSRLAELDDVNQAFNGSMGALNAFAKYVPRQLVSRLIEEGMTMARNIEVREMTIVFTDLAGFTNLASHLSAEETASYLNGYFETVSEAIAERDGTIDKFLGDGVMAFWGAPSDQPDHAAMAIAAVKSLSDKIAQHDQGDMRLRIGIHTGKVVVGDIGSAARMNYTVIGDAVNVAARLQEYGKQVDPTARVIALASGETMAQLPEGTTATSLGPVHLRGRDEPLTLFRIV